MIGIGYVYLGKNDISRKECDAFLDQFAKKHGLKKKLGMGGVWGEKPDGKSKRLGGRNVKFLRAVFDYGTTVEFWLASGGKGVAHKKEAKCVRVLVNKRNIKLSKKQMKDRNALILHAGRVVKEMEDQMAAVGKSPEAEEDLPAVKSAPKPAAAKELYDLSRKTLEERVAGKEKTLNNLKRDITELTDRNKQIIKGIAGKLTQASSLGVDQSRIDKIMATP